MAFFSAKGGSDVERPKLMKAIYELATGTPLSPEENEDREKLFLWVEKAPDAKERVINAAIAIKLAINLFNIERA